MDLKSIAKEITTMRSEEYWQEQVKTGKDPLVRLIVEALQKVREETLDEAAEHIYQRWVKNQNAAQLRLQILSLKQSVKGGV